MSDWEDAWLDDDRLGPEVSAVECPDEEGRAQSVHVRVGPVFHGNMTDPQPGIWVEYQENHRKGNMLGPVLLTPQVWRQLNRAVEYRLTRRGLPLWKRVLLGLGR